MRRAWTAVGVALVLPMVAVAGPIRVRLDARLHTPAGHDWVARSLTDASPADAVAPDPAAPVVVSLLRIQPPDLPSDTPGSPFQGGATYYQSDYFTLDVRLTDVATGETGVLSYGGRLHADYTYAGNDVWSPSAYVWLAAGPQSIALGGNLYTLNPEGGHYAYIPDPGRFEVYVGGLAPQPLPEPGTLALAGLGLAALVGRRFRLLTHT